MILVDRAGGREHKLIKRKGRERERRLTSSTLNPDISGLETGVYVDR